MTARIEAFVHGMPAPQGSKRHVGGGRMVESSQKVAPWREAVKQALLRQGFTTLVGPLHVGVVFALPRPKHHYRTGANNHLLRDNAPVWVTTKPDIDKLLRSTLDALTDVGLWADDSQVASVHTGKSYVSDPTQVGALITVVELT